MMCVVYMSARIFVIVGLWSSTTRLIFLNILVFILGCLVSKNVVYVSIVVVVLWLVIRSVIKLL